MNIDLVKQLIECGHWKRSLARSAIDAIVTELMQQDRVMTWQEEEMFAYLIQCDNNWIKSNT